MSTAKAEVHRGFFTNAHNWLEKTMAGSAPERIGWHPPGSAICIAGHSGHGLTVEDAAGHFGPLGRPPTGSGARCGEIPSSEGPPMRNGHLF